MESLTTDQGRGASRWRRLSILGAVLGLATISLYVWLLTSQPDGTGSSTWIWLGAMALPSVLATTALLCTHGALAKVLLLGSGLMYLGVGIPSIFSVGVGFLAAATLEAIAFLRHPGTAQNTAQGVVRAATPR